MYLRRPCVRYLPNLLRMLILSQLPVTPGNVQRSPVVFWPDGHSFSTERIDVSGFPHNDADLKIPLCTFTVAHNHASDETVQ